MREMLLSGGLVTVVDESDFEALSKWRWSSHRPPTASSWYVTRREAGKTIYMHRQLMGFPVGMDIDHIDGDGLNNCRSNLRVCTRGGNMKNRRSFCTHPAKTSRFKGVANRRGAHGEWTAMITSDGVRYCVEGFFATEEAAARAYDQMALHYHGEFARLNFPDAN